MRIDHLAFGLTAGLTCASCGGTMAGLSQGIPALMAGSSLASTTNARSVGRTDSLASTGPEKCRPIESVVTYGGEKVPSYGRACEQPDGSWVVLASSDPANISDAISPAPRRRMSAFAYSPYEDPWCTMGRPGFAGAYGPGFGGMYGGGFALRHRRR